jgi:hypothetical protein
MVLLSPQRRGVSMFHTGPLTVLLGSIQSRSTSIAGLRPSCAAVVENGLHGAGALVGLPPPFTVRSKSFQPPLEVNLVMSGLGWLQGNSSADVFTLYCDTE